MCAENVCIGSVMTPNLHSRKPDEVRTKVELLPLATDFINQYYTSIRRQVQHPGQQQVKDMNYCVCLKSVYPNTLSCPCRAYRFGSKAHLDRLEEVTKEIEASGTYQLKDTELIYGAKHAWRNAARCVGRIQWSKLQVMYSVHTVVAVDVIWSTNSFSCFYVCLPGV